MLGLSVYHAGVPVYVSRETIGYGFGCSSRGGLYVWELGVFKGTFGEYKAGDALEIVVSGSTVIYHHNEEVVFTSSAEAEFPLVPSSCFYSAAAGE
jgi:hypothetical protein